MITDSGISRCGNAKRGMKQDRQTKPAIKTREQKRRDIEDANEFAKILGEMCPEYFGGK